jgi:hypothetical protein
MAPEEDEMNQKPKKKTFRASQPICDDTECVSERDALSAGLALLDAKWEGNSDFDKGMRIIQKHLNIKR